MRNSNALFTNPMYVIPLTEVSVTIDGNQKRVAWITQKDQKIIDDNSVSIPIDATCDNCLSQGFTSWSDPWCTNTDVSGETNEIIGEEGPRICPVWEKKIC